MYTPSVAATILSAAFATVLLPRCTLADLTLLRLLLWAFQDTVLAAAAVAALVEEAFVLRSYLSNSANAATAIEAFAGIHVLWFGLVPAWLRCVGDFRPLA